MCNGFLGLLSILFILWMISKLVNSDSGNLSQKLLYLEDDFKYEIKELRDKIFKLEVEINKLKGIPEKFQQQEIVHIENIEAGHIADYNIDKTFENIPEPDHVSESTYALNSEPEVKEYNEKVVPVEEGFVGVLEQACKKPDFESFIAGNILNRIGALALIIGMGFFLKYAFDQNWINPVVQILIGFLVSGGLLYGASYFNKKEDYKVFAQGLAGAGIAISYLSIFAAYSFYNLFSYPVAFILMLTTTILAFFQSLKYDSMAVALLGLAGGFVTPFILYSGDNNVAGLFTYLGFLNCWIIALLYKKENWKAVEIISLLATYIIYFSLQGGSFYSDNWPVAGLFLTIIWGLYFGLDISRIARGIKDFNSAIIVSNILNLIMFYFGIYGLFDHNNHNATAFITLLIALVYLASGILIYNKYNKPEVYLKKNVLVSVIFLTLATNIACTGFVKVIIWSIEAFGILYLGLKYNKTYIWKSSTYLFSMAFLALLFNKQTYVYTPLDSFIPIFNLRVLAFTVLTGLSILSTKLLDKSENNGSIQSFYRYSWCTLLFILFSVEINDFMSKLAIGSSSDIYRMISYNKHMIQVIVWMSYSVRLILMGLKNNTRPFIYCGFIGTGIAVFQLLIAGHTFIPLEKFIPVINLRFIAFAITALSLMFIAKTFKKYEDKYSWGKDIHNILSYSWCIIIFILINFEINDFFTKKMSYGISESIDFSKSMILGLAWSLYSLPLIKKGLDKKNLPLLICGGAGILFAIILGLFKGFSFEPVQNFVFLFNLRMFMFSVSIVVLIIINSWFKQYSTNYPVITQYIKILQVVLSLLILYLLTIEAKDLFAREIYSLTNGGYYIDNKVGLLRNLKQLSLSGIWLLYSIGLMIWGILKRVKPVRYVALVILGITIFKIFVIDLSFLDQLYRIVSFIGLGVIMLLSSYYYQKYSKQIHDLITDDLESLKKSL